MTYYYSKTTNGFYVDDIHETMPSDAVAITDSVYHQLLTDQSNGLLIQADSSGKPISAAPVFSAAQLKINQIVILQNSITDRMKIEAMAGSTNVFQSGTAYAGKTAAQAIAAIQEQIDTIRSS